MTSASRQWPYFLLTACWLAAFVLSCRLAITTASAFRQTGTGNTLAGKILGESRFVAGIHFFDLADRTYHGGQGHVTKQAFKDRFFQNLLEETAPTAHIHLSGNRIREIMPWLWFAIRTNPHNVDAYLVVAFWLRSSGVWEPDVALDVLQEAQANNPFNYQIQMEKAVILLKKNQLNKARKAFETGLAFWPRPLAPNNEEALSDKATILLYLAALSEARGDKDQAIGKLTEILAIFPDRQILQKRIDDIRAGNQPSVLAPALWHDMLLRDEQLKIEHSCDRAAGSGHDERNHHDHSK